jgi:hypothetical protein
LIRLEKISPDKLKCGDIVGIKSDNNENVLVHRILRIERNLDNHIFATKGDNNLNYDPSISAKNILGKARYVVRGARQIDLESPFMKIVGPILSVFSRLNLNLRHLVDNFITRSLKKVKWLAPIPAFFFTKKVELTVFRMPDGTKILRALSGKFCIAQAFFDDGEASLAVLHDWTIRYPFYYSVHGKNFLASILNYFSNAGKTSLTFSRLYVDNPAFALFEGLKDQGIIEINPETGVTIKLK